MQPLSIIIVKSTGKHNVLPQQQPRQRYICGEGRFSYINITKLRM